jgi:hypothetical protein
MNILRWVLLVVSFVFAVVFHRRIRLNQGQKAAFGLIILFVLANIAFLVYASPFAYRYILPLHFPFMVISFILLNHFDKVGDRDIAR